MVKNLPANARDIRNSGLIHRSERSPGGGNGNPLQYSCLENPMDRRAWGATVNGVIKSDTTEHSTHIHISGKMQTSQRSEHTWAIISNSSLSKYFHLLHGESLTEGK